MAIDRDKVAKNALRYIQKGQFNKAIDEYKRVLALDPRDIRTRLKLIDLYGRAGLQREGIDECLHVAESYSDQGFYLKAIAVYKQALRIDPANAMLYRQMGEMYVKQGLVGDALAAFKRGVEVLRGQGAQEEALDLLARMEEMAPENAAIKIHLAELYLEDGKYEEFEAQLSKVVLQLRGEGRSGKLLKAVEYFYEASNHHPSVLKCLAELYVDLGEEEKALQVIEAGLKSSPGDRDLRLLSLRAHLVLGHLPEARRMALSLYEENPDDVFILEQLASIAQARGDVSEMAEAYKAMAKVYGRRGIEDQERRCYKKVLELSGEDAEARLALGELIVETGQKPAGGEPAGQEEEREDAEVGGPTGVDEVHEGLMEAELYLKYGIEEKAAERLRQLTDLAPDDIDIRQKLRDLCHRQGDREGWVREQLRIAELFLGAKRENEALRAYESILEVDPDNAEARKSIQLLKPDAFPESPASITIEIDGDSLEPGGDLGAGQVVQPATPSEIDSRDEALQDALAEADFYKSQGLAEEAVNCLKGLLGKYPGSPAVTSRLEQLGWKAGPSAEGGEEAYVDLQAEVLDSAGISLGSGFEGFQDFEVSELDDIVKEFKSGISEKLDEGDYETHYNLGVAYREMGLLEDAVQEFQIAARFPDKARDAYTSLALVFEDMEKTEDAQNALRAALSVPSNTPEDRAAILYEMGGMAEKCGDWNRALQSFRKVVEIDPTHRDAQNRVRKLTAMAEG